ncbi:MAG: DMT family transporter [Bradyrhizobium sp.]|nr:MAG: DMT family transporter [Bradyrhizobium sp.]
MTDLSTTAPARSWRAVWDSPILLLTLTALIWAANAIVSRLAVGEIAPMTLTWGRWAIAAPLILFAARKRLAADFAALRAHWLYVGAMGALGFTGFNALYYAAAHRTGAINLSIIQGAIPAFVLIAARIGFGEKVAPLQALGVAATMLGVTTIAAQGSLARLAALAFNMGDLMVLAACFLYAGYTLALRDRPRVSGVGFLAGLAIAAFVTSTPLFVAETAAGDFIRPGWMGWLLLLVAALGPAFAGQLFYIRGVELIGPGRAGVFVNLVPVFGALMAVVLLGEPFAPYHIVALALVAGGIAVAQRAKLQQQ